MIDLARYSEKRTSVNRQCGRKTGNFRTISGTACSTSEKGGAGEKHSWSLWRLCIGEKPSEISVGDVLRALEGSLEPVKCAAFDTTTGEGCMASDGCVTKYVWQKINDSINDTVNQIMLDELIRESKKHQSGWRV